MQCAPGTRTCLLALPLAYLQRARKLSPLRNAVATSVDGEFGDSLFVKEVHTFTVSNATVCFTFLTTSLAKHC